MNGCDDILVRSGSLLDLIPEFPFYFKRNHFPLYHYILNLFRPLFPEARFVSNDQLELFASGCEYPVVCWG